MNYLAHVTLAEPTDEARLGALLGDFARGLQVERLSETMRFALEEHRAVDRWFDAHPLVRAERERFPVSLRRYSGILLDVFADHVLVRHWNTLEAQPLDDVTSSLYRSFDTHEDLLPPRLAQIAPRMARDDWLGSYGEARNVGRALAGISMRMRRDNPIAEGIHELERRGDEIEACVLTLWPEVRRWTRERRARSGRG
ncbi:MAG: ACP phosphodiesterase [Planctomycetota bacterium]